ncbi:MAG: hypothetical protein ACLQU2_30355 [Candidatus Binataceae bacterium]
MTRHIILALRLGYCFGGLLSVIWTALYPDAVKNLVTLATPIDASVEGSPLYTLAARLPDEVLDSILQLHGNCPAALINGWFTAMAPVHHALSKYLDLHTNKRNTGYLEMFTRFERWMNSDVPLAGGNCSGNGRAGVSRQSAGEFGIQDWKRYG